MTFRDRVDAGRKLAAALEQYRSTSDAIVISLPRGGVVVGAEVARALGLPLDIVVPRKIGAPGNPEYAIGAITEAGEVVWNEEALALTGPTEEYKRKTIAAEQQEAERRLKMYRGDRPPRDVKGKTVLLVDDGIATGATVRAAIRTLCAEGAQRIVLAVPVAAADSIAALRSDLHFSPSSRGGARGGAESDDIAVLYTPQWFGAVGAFYDTFEQTTDEEVIALLASTRK